MKNNHPFPALSETGGGLAPALGPLTPLVGAAFLGAMIKAIGVKWGGGFYAPTGIGFELLLATAAGALCLMGAGGIALDRAMPLLRQHRLSYGVAAVPLGTGTPTILLIIRG
ncbi:hypothetical protein Sgleb_12390 [Streptomyces glebosus]|uniref:Uncharacterized protein n=1 Tax=Streptomyces glebosus TaxID=249580 RepID=A0A640SQU7_9ACTN|nr:hypothetical protein [Streptomyces glebosus]GFE13192.1 hypothetical protein Sgleb_12390 [Streptomyces glebosus]GHG78635.1 hypothetical protein GCM10010513_55340 [Streptomyces glebosus]